MSSTSVPRDVARGRLVVDAVLVAGSWLAAHGLCALTGSPTELLALPKLASFAPAAPVAAVCWCMLGVALGVHRPSAPWLSVGMLARLTMTTLLHLALLLGVASVLSPELASITLLVTCALLTWCATVGSRALVAMIAPYGLDLSRLPRRRRAARSLVVRSRTVPQAGSRLARRALGERER